MTKKLQVFAMNTIIIPTTNPPPWSRERQSWWSVRLIVQRNTALIGPWISPLIGR